MGFWPHEEYSIRLKRPVAEVMRMMRTNTLPGKPVKRFGSVKHYGNKLLSVR